MPYVPQQLPVRKKLTIWVSEVEENYGPLVVAVNEELENLWADESVEVMDVEFWSETGGHMAMIKYFTLYRYEEESDF